MVSRWAYGRTDVGLKSQDLIILKSYALARNAVRHYGL